MFYTILIFMSAIIFLCVWREAHTFEVIGKRQNAGFEIYEPKKFELTVQNPIIGQKNIYVDYNNYTKCNIGDFIRKKKTFIISMKDVIYR